MTTSQIAKKYSLSVVTIIAVDENGQPLSLGSGFFINENGEIVTNYHVLEGSANATVKTIKGEKGDIIEVIKADPKLDLIVARTSLKNTVPVRLGDSDKIEPGEDIVAIGNPAGLERTVSKGIISAIRKTEGIDLIQITAPISPGSSGGPVFNLSGETIGVATAYLAAGQNLNFAMPINYLKSLKTTSLKIGSLMRSSTSIKSEQDTSSVKVSGIHYNRCEDSLCSIDFSLQNGNTYPIKNVTLFFVYKMRHAIFKYPERARELINKLLKEGKYDEYLKESSKYLEKEWYEVMSYSAVKVKETILPRLGLQFNHEHLVKHFYDTSAASAQNASVEIRILDYDIVRETKTLQSPTQRGGKLNRRK
jgi:hypothetical protein